MPLTTKQTTPSRLKEWLNSKSIGKVGMGDGMVVFLFEDGTHIKLEIYVSDYDEFNIEAKFSDNDFELLEWSE